MYVEIGALLIFEAPTHTYSEEILLNLSLCFFGVWGLVGFAHAC
jgi:hypothetical protein